MRTALMGIAFTVVLCGGFGLGYVIRDQQLPFVQGPGTLVHVVRTGGLHQGRVECVRDDGQMEGK